MEITAEWEIPVGGKWPLAFRFKNDDLGGSTIAEASETLPPATGMTIGSMTVNTDADGFWFWATATTAGEYSIAIVATRADGGKNVVLGHVSVVAAADRTSLAANALVTLADFRGFVGELAPKNLAETLINAISQEFDRYCNRKLAKATYNSAKLNGTGLDVLYLPNWPVISVTSIYEDNILLTEDVDYEVDAEAGALYRLNGYWSKGRRNVVITFAAGFVVQGATPGAGETALPADIAASCLKQCAAEYMRAKQKLWADTARSIEGGSISLVEPGLLRDVQAVLERYRRLCL